MKSLQDDDCHNGDVVEGVDFVDDDDMLAACGIIGCVVMSVLFWIGVWTWI